MDDLRQKKWFAITVYLLSSLGILGLMLFFAEKYFPGPSPDLIDARSDRASSRSFNSPSWNSPTLLNPSASRPAAAGEQQQRLFLPLNKKATLGNAELIYRGLTGESEFQIDVIIPELDPQVSYSYRFKIADAEKSFRLADHNLKILSLTKNALHLMQLGD